MSPGREADHRNTGSRRFPLVQPRIATAASRRVPPVATAIAALTLAAAVALALQPTTQRPPGRSGDTEALEQSISTEGRLDALRIAREDGLFASTAVTGQAAPGWLGAVPMKLGTDDWEPAIAADPNAPYVYWLATRYGKPKPCAGNCPTPYTAMQISTDGGETWGKARPLCACKGKAQYDPIVEVVPETGDVYALYMNGYNVVFLRSTDHGKTWTDPVSTYGNVSWTDKPALTTSSNGKHVYVTWNGPRGGDPWAAVSHDFGRTWSQQRIVENDRYFFAYDGTVLSDGTVILSQSSFDYSGPAASAIGGVEQHLFISTNRGLSWKDVLSDTLNLGPPCTTDYCYADFHSGHSGVSSDLDDRIYHVYDGATRHLGPQSVWFRMSSNEGATWSDRHPAVGARRALHGADDRGHRPRRPPRVVRLAGRGHATVGDLRAALHGRRPDVERPGRDLRRDLGQRLRQRERVPRVLRRLRRDRREQRGQDRRDVGRGLQLARTRERLGERRGVTPRLRIRLGPGVSPGRGESR